MARAQHAPRARYDSARLGSIRFISVSWLTGRCPACDAPFITGVLQPENRPSATRPSPHRSPSPLHSYLHPLLTLIPSDDPPPTQSCSLPLKPLPRFCFGHHLLLLFVLLPRVRDATTTTTTITTTITTITTTAILFIITTTTTIGHNRGHT